jgi:hypothetical protein
MRQASAQRYNSPAPYRYDVNRWHALYNLDPVAVTYQCLGGRAVGSDFVPSNPGTVDGRPRRNRASRRRRRFPLLLRLLSGERALYRA